MKNYKCILRHSKGFTVPFSIDVQARDSIAAITEIYNQMQRYGIDPRTVELLDIERGAAHHE